MISVNLFNLHDRADEAHPKGQIKVSNSPELAQALRTVLSDIRQTKRMKLKDIASEIGISYVDLWDFQNGRPVPLYVLERLSMLASKITGKPAAEFSTLLQNRIQRLEYGAGPNKKVCKAPKFIDHGLAKIAGAHAADGCLKCRATVRNGIKITRYEFVIKDEYFSNLKAFAGWMESTFGMKPEIKKEKRHKGWFIYIGNKILFRYLNRILQFPVGKKSDCVKVPSMITASHPNIQLAFCLGAFTFDGCVNYRTGYVDFLTKSYELFREINGILNAVKIQPDFISKQADHLGRWTIRFRRYENLEKCLALFEPMTEKWRRLCDHVFGPSGNANNVKELLEKFEKAYPKVNPNALIFSDVIQAVIKLGGATSKEVSSFIGRGNTITYEFLTKLVKWRILNTENEFHKTYRKRWKFNENHEEWNVPEVIHDLDV